MENIIEKDNRTEQLKNLESMLTVALKAGKGGLWDWDTEIDKFYLSASYYLILGYEPYEKPTADSGMIDHIHPEDRVKTETDFYQTANQKKKNLFVEFRVVAKSGETQWFCCYGERVAQKNDNRKFRMIGLIVDINVFKQIENQLSESNRRLSALMNNLPGMAYRNELINGSWKLTLASNGVKKLLGYNLDQFIQKRENPDGTLIDQEDYLRIWEKIYKAIKEERPYQLIYRIKINSGQFKWILEQGEAVFSDDGKLIGLEGFMMDITYHKKEELRLKSSLHSISEERYRFGDIIGKSPSMHKVYDQILKTATDNSNVIIYGESGTGKELVARAIHKFSERGSDSFVPVNCGAIPSNLFESEFFGYKKGAFTGANVDHKGYLAVADGGTLFLDEIGDISLDFQVKLLRVLEGQGYMPIGSNEFKMADVRIISATNRNLLKMVDQGKLRQDFFFRIHIIPIRLPPLRNRREDIPLLIDHFLKKFQTKNNHKNIPDEIRAALQQHDWPGNIRELRNVIQRYLSLGEIEIVNRKQAMDAYTPSLSSQSCFSAALGKGGLKASTEAFEKEVICKVLEHNHWRRDKTAQALGITLRTLYRKMKLYRIN